MRRRKLFELAGASSASFLFSHAFGCQSSTTEPLPMLPEDPEGRWWLSGNYGPVDDEIEAFDLEVVGSLPPELDGVFVRNSANPQEGSAHWFTGDGMLHGVRISRGQALWYRNRWIQTSALRLNMPDNLLANRANTSVKIHNGKLLALYEVSKPYEIDPSDLSTIGEYDFEGELIGPMTAHPKIDPETGELFSMGFSPFPPYLTYHVVNAEGQMVTKVNIESDNPSMMHDFQITEDHAIFYDLPVHFDVDALSSGFPFRWVDDAPARIGIAARDGSATQAQWFEIDQCFMFHSFNAYEDGSEIVLEGCRMNSLWRNGLDDMSSDPPPRPWRWRFDPEAGTVREEQLFEHFTDFPIVDARRHGRRHRMLYALKLVEDATIPFPNGIIKHDLQTGSTQVWDGGSRYQPDEALFIPADAGEDEGWLLSMVFDRETVKSEVMVFDATDIESGPIARIKMPRRVPFGFHGTFFPMG